MPHIEVGERTLRAREEADEERAAMGADRVVRHIERAASRAARDQLAQLRNLIRSPPQPAEVKAVDLRHACI